MLVTKCLEQTFLQVNKVAEENPYTYITEILSRFDLSKGKVENILHDDLHLQKKNARWIPDVMMSFKRNRVLALKELLGMLEPCGKNQLCSGR